jgi:peroxiredoxin
VKQQPVSIADQVAELRASRPPSPVFAAEQAALATSSRQSLVPLGSPFPDGDLTDAEGQPTTLRAVLAGAAGVIIFYRGAWCPYCNIALRAYRDQLTAPLRDLGVGLVAISPQSADGSMTMQEKLDLEFAVLSDPGNQIAAALGILTHPSDDARAMQLEHGLDITALNADGTTNVPMPTTAIVNADGTLAWIDVHPDYTTRTEPAQILAELQKILATTGLSKP